ncbi:MAG: acyltransferase [Caulobacteraceae bacterium]
MQCLRAVAAISVVTFHAANGGFEVGQAGVDVFFIISGFIMWAVTARPITPTVFLRDRVARIVPLYWTATALMAVGSGLSLFPHLHADLSDYLRSLFFIPYRQDGRHAWPLLVAGWTLNYEMFFYLLCAALLLANLKQRLISLTVVLTALTLVGLLVHFSNVFYGFYTNSIVLEFAFGLLLAALSLHWEARSPWVGGLLILIGCAAFVGFSVTHLHLNRIVQWGLPSLLLVAGSVWLEQAGVSITPRPLVYIGDASYSIYLIHPFVISVGRKLVPHAWAPAAWLVMLMASLAIGCLVYVGFERPVMRLLRPARRHPQDVEVTNEVLSGGQI